MLVCFFPACDSMKTELDIDIASFPPRLSVTALLDAEKGHFRVALYEGRALSDQASNYMEIIHNGEIRLFEDNQLILSEAVKFNLTMVNFQFPDNDCYSRLNPFERYGIPTTPGSVYRLEVEMEGYQTVVSNAVMPAVPVVSASVNTDARGVKHDCIMLYPLGEGSSGGNPYDGSYFWPVSVRLTDPAPDVLDYFALEIHRFRSAGGIVEEVQPHQMIGVTDLSILQDNPEYEAMGLFIDTERRADSYLFPAFLMSDLTFSGKDASLTFYTVMEIIPSADDLTFFENNPAYEKVHCTTTLSIQHLSASTFKYYRGLTLQNTGIGFFTEPVIITGNVENGYGCFSVSNSLSVTLLEYDAYAPKMR
jgi:hypothetical protein